AGGDRSIRQFPPTAGSCPSRWYRMRSWRACMMHQRTNAFTVGRMNIETPKTEAVGTRLTPEEAAGLDRLAERWKLDRSRTLRRLVNAAEKEQALDAIETATWPRELPVSPSGRYVVHKDGTVS